MIIDIVFEEKLSSENSPVKEFVEVENLDGASIGVGEWIDRDDGYTVLRLEIAE